MRLTLILLILGISLISSAVPGKMEVDWTVVESGLDFTISRLKTSMQYMTEQAVTGNETLGQEFSSYLGDKFDGMIPTFDSFRNEIKTKVLTVESTETYYEILVSSWNDLADGMAYLLAQLPSYSKENIRLDIRRSRDGLIDDKEWIIQHLQP